MCMFDYVYCDHDNSASYQLKEELVCWLTVVRKPCQTVCASCHSCVGMGCIPARRAMRPLIRPHLHGNVFAGIHNVLVAFTSSVYTKTVKTIWKMDVFEDVF